MSECPAWAGERGRRKNVAYCTSKAALTTYLEALRNRVSRYGVNVVTVKPGFVDTPMTAGLKLRGAISAERAAKEILALAPRRLEQERLRPDQVGAHHVHHPHDPDAGVS